MQRVLLLEELEVHMQDLEIAHGAASIHDEKRQPGVAPSSPAAAIVHVPMYVKRLCL